MKNWFSTLNESLNSENLLDLYPTGINLAYSQVINCANSGVFFTITRDNKGMYERPIHYKTLMCDSTLIYNI